VSRLSGQCGILNISQPYKPPRPVTRIALLYFTWLSSRTRLWDRKTEVISLYNILRVCQYINGYGILAAWQIRVHYVCRIWHDPPIMISDSVTFSLLGRESFWSQRVVQLLNNPAICYGIRRFITVSTRANHSPLSWVTMIQSVPPHPILLESIFSLPSLPWKK
jgi:hypothetical protein